jgi:hypothetical protein
MSSTVFKWKLQPGTQHISMPYGSQVIHVAEQHGDLCMWTVGDIGLVKKSRTFTVVPTGMTFGEGRHVGSALLEDGLIVMHVFEVGIPL